MKLLAIDMDGTCLNEKSKITPRTMAALQQAAEAGIQVVPTTGRTLSCIPHQLREQNFYRYVISSNGARITDVKTGETIFRALIPENTAQQLLDACKALPLGITAHAENDFYIQGRCLSAMGHLIYGRDADRSIRVRDVSKVLRDSRHDVEELQLFFFSPRAQQQVKDLLSEYPGLSAAYTRQYVEIFSVRANKGAALAALAGQLSVPKAEITCIGDGENDLSMFRQAGLRFAMGNGVPALKAQADHVLPSNRADGVAEAITNYLLSGTQA